MTVTSIISELGEVLKEYQGWKDWKRKKVTNEENLLIEIVDLWHFIINLSLYLGYDSDEIYNGFLTKNKINHDRQDKNY